MSKLDIGVGDEFPLEEGQAEERGRGRGRHRHGHHHGHRHGPGHHAHHHDFHHRRHHARRTFRSLPLLVTIVAVAALIGTGKLSALATDAILVFAAVMVVLAMGARFWAHRRWHAQRIAQ